MVSPGAGIVNGFGQYLLACAGFARDQNWNFAGGMKFCFLHDPEHPFRLGDYGRKNPGICEIEKSLLPAYPVNFQKVFSFQGF